jgi:biotin carboxyl carrier protein
MQTDTQVLKKSKNVKQENILVKDNCKDKKVRCKTLIIHGGKYRTTFTRKFENRKVWSQPDEKKVLTYIPGTVNEIYIKEGDIVKQGEKILILEAMKMFNTITAPHDAMVKKIYVTMGESIPKGFVMLEFE